MVRKSFIQMISSTGYTAYSTVLCRVYGVYEAILLGKLAHLYESFNYQEFYFQQNRIAYETGLSERSVLSGIKRLKDKNLITITKKGNPCKNYYTVNWELIQNTVDKNCEENAGMNPFGYSQMEETISSYQFCNNVTTDKTESSDCYARNVEQVPQNSYASYNYINNNDHKYIFNSQFEEFKKSEFLQPEAEAERSSGIYAKLNFSEYTNLCDKLRNDFDTEISEYLIGLITEGDNCYNLTKAFKDAIAEYSVMAYTRLVTPAVSLDGPVAESSGNTIKGDVSSTSTLADDTIYSVPDSILDDVNSQTENNTKFNTTTSTEICSQTHEDCSDERISKKSSNLSSKPKKSPRKRNSVKQETPHSLIKKHYSENRKFLFDSGKLKNEYSSLNSAFINGRLNDILEYADVEKIKSALDMGMTDSFVVDKLDYDFCKMISETVIKRLLNAAATAKPKEEPKKMNVIKVRTGWCSDCMSDYPWINPRTETGFCPLCDIPMVDYNPEIHKIPRRI